ncbi:MAG: putative PIG3 family NAD(P)H quinone oxidoreductase [Alcanivorax sp.]|jgi:putative PIG3 family NAD(P)H quinone oxidoreductase
MNNSAIHSETRRIVAINSDDQSLSITHEPIPKPGPGEVLIKVHSAGLNRADLMQRAGLYPPPTDASPIMGLEVSGEVIALGEGVATWQPGDKLCALTHGGGYADYTIAPVSQCLPVPTGYSMEEAAALPEALLTVWHNLFQRCQLRAGEKALIHGGASGIGTLGIAIAKAMGADVYTTAGNAAKCQALERLGATRAINYREEDFETVLTDLGLRDKINVILDMVGGDFVQKNLNVAAAEGRIVCIAFIRGFKAELNLVPLLMKRLTVTGSTLRAQSFAQKAIMVKEILEQVYPHLESGAVKPIIDSSYLLENVADAQQKMQGGTHMGKILLTM